MLFGAAAALAIAVIVGVLFLFTSPDSAERSALCRQQFACWRYADELKTGNAASPPPENCTRDGRLSHRPADMPNLIECIFRNIH
ncbi:MAG TPA: hypothetical protein VMI30_07640 [Stellaceae bacterium]|nr:hypothetical protein [Stellaceae bacterium]